MTIELLPDKSALVPYSNSTVVADPFALTVAETVAVSDVLTFDAATVVAEGDDASSEVNTYETRKVTELFAGMESYLKLLHYQMVRQQHLQQLKYLRY